MGEPVSHIVLGSGNLSDDEFNQGLDTIAAVSGASIETSRREAIYALVGHIKDGRWRRLIRLFCEEATTVHRGTNIAGAILRLHKTTPYRSGGWSDESSEECLACPLCDGVGTITLRRWLPDAGGVAHEYSFRCPHEHTKPRYKGLFAPLRRALPNWKSYTIRAGFVRAGDEETAAQVVFEVDEQDGKLMLPFRERESVLKREPDGDGNALF